MLLSLALWIQATDFFTWLRGSAYAYPVVLSLHMVAIALFGGMILMTDMRLLGWAMRKHPVADVVDQFRVPKRYGFLLVAVCGLLMLGCKAEEYYYNIFFRTKVVLLILVAVHALIFRGSVYARAADFDRASRVPGLAKFAAALSLLLWIGIACMGRGIGYIEPPIGIHAQLLWPL
jgi:Trk-type K+ transport system membrane component